MTDSMKKDMKYDEFSPAGIREKNSSGWSKMLQSWVFHEMHLKYGLPGWELGHSGWQLEVRCGFVHGTGQQASDIAREWDDICHGQFYYRDHTDDGIPFVRDGDVYLSSFAFQLTTDYLHFIEMYGAVTQFGVAKELLMAWDAKKMVEWEKADLKEMHTSCFTDYAEPANQIYAAPAINKHLSEDYRQTLADLMVNGEPPIS
jgi:hypothetical protein